MGARNSPGVSSRERGQVTAVLLLASDTSPDYNPGEHVLQKWFLEICKRKLLSQRCSP